MAVVQLSAYRDDPAHAAGAARVPVPLDSADARLIDAYGAARCLSDEVLPWRSAGAATVVAFADADRIAALRPGLEARLGPVRAVLAPANGIRDRILAARGARLTRAAETGLPATDSCRTPLPPGARAGALAALSGLAALALTEPRAAFGVLVAIALMAMAGNVGLRLLAVVRVMLARRSGSAPQTEHVHAVRPPPMSIMVPLFRERAVAERLVARLGRLTYPRGLLEVCLVVEEDDHITQETLTGITLPGWMRVIVVPGGSVKTKPRALNFALGQCRGEIIGVYDAEDAPAPDQLERVAAAFEASPREVACLQGILDFYNARRNWLSRCFTVEYASWFRVILPGLARMGLVLPLGGTTFFIRRSVLEEVGGWDAWNVTEDADLGIRLARRGYRTELIETVTEEEANSWAWPWVRQRSRWLKGYAMTWALHMRDPGRLWAELGGWRFMGVQVLLLGTLAQFVLAPAIWSFWLMIFGLPHPMAGLVPGAVLMGLWGVLILSEVVTVATGVLAVSRPGRRWLLPWVPTLHLYYPLAVLAVLRGLAELAYRPFYWDKTEHGAFDVAEATDPSETALSGPAR